MSLTKLDNLLKTGQLKAEPFSENEFTGMMHSGASRLKDALNDSLSIDSRFDLAYNAAHAFALAALRKYGYRSNNRFVVFQALPHTLGIEAGVWRILAKCHNLRNIAEYEGYLEIDDRLFQELLEAVRILFESVKKIS